MKFIHLSDLHLGKRVNEYSMLEDQEYILKKIINIVDAEKPDGVIIAGDVYDKSVPAAEAVQLFDNFLVQLAKRKLEVFVISGNHDSPERIAFGSRIMDASGIHMSPVYNGKIVPFSMQDEYGTVDVHMLPFIKPAHVRRFCDDEITTYTDAINSAISKLSMAIYHLEAKVVSRGAGRSAVAASAYLSCSRLYNDYDGIQHDYTKKQGLVWQEVFLPEYAPQEWKDREQLWNAVEEVETAKDSRLAREFVVTLPIELSREEQIELLQEFIREQFVSDGMCADAAIHDTDGHNPHAHILLTVRPLDERGKWQYKTEKEYLCMKNGEERGFTAAEFRAAQNEGWEKQYPYKVGKKKVYMTPSAAEAQGLVRADKHPKSTRYGRQNPISERWNSEEQLTAWRAAWADVSNRCLERAGREERIDHRSNAARGLDEQPTIHEGVTARALERKGIIADRCEINRQIKVDNALLRELKAEIKKLTALVARTVPAIAEGLEKLRSRVLIFCYRLSHIRSGKSHIQKSLAVWKPELERYTDLVQQIKAKSKERKTLVAEKKELPIYHVKRHKALAVRIAELTEDLEELRSEKSLLLQKFEYAEDAGAEAFRKDIAIMEAGLKKLEAQEQKYSAELDKALDEYAELKAQAADFDSVELYKARQVLRPAQEKAAERQLEETLQKKPSFSLLLSAKQEVSRLLGEDTEERQARQMVIRRQRSDPQKPKHFQR